MDSGLEAYIEVENAFPEIPMIFMTSLGEEIRPYFTGVTDEWILIVEKPVEPDQIFIDYSWSPGYGTPNLK